MARTISVAVQPSGICAIRASNSWISVLAGAYNPPIWGGTSAPIPLPPRPRSRGEFGRFSATQLAGRRSRRRIKAASPFGVPAIAHRGYPPTRQYRKSPLPSYAPKGYGVPLNARIERGRSAARAYTTGPSEIGDSCPRYRSRRVPYLGSGAMGRVPAFCAPRGRAAEGGWQSPF